MLCALNSRHRDVHELSRHPDNRLPDGRRSSEIADCVSKILTVCPMVSICLGNP